MDCVIMQVILSNMTSRQIIDQAWTNLFDLDTPTIGQIKSRQVVALSDGYQTKYQVSFSWTGERWDLLKIESIH